MSDSSCLLELLRWYAHDQGYLLDPWGLTAPAARAYGVAMTQVVAVEWLAHDCWDKPPCERAVETAEGVTVWQEIEGTPRAEARQVIAALRGAHAASLEARAEVEVLLRRQQEPAAVELLGRRHATATAAAAALAARCIGLLGHVPALLAEISAGGECLAQSLRWMQHHLGVGRAECSALVEALGRQLAKVPPTWAPDIEPEDLEYPGCLAPIDDGLGPLRAVGDALAAPLAAPAAPAVARLTDAEEAGARYLVECGCPVRSDDLGRESGLEPGGYRRGLPSRLVELGYARKVKRGLYEATDRARNDFACPDCPEKVRPQNA